MNLPESIPQGLEYGRVRDLLHLDPEDMQIAPIAERLAKINRFAGATKWPYSVATHSVLVSHLCPLQFERAGLLHDITESFGIGDIILPIKRSIPAVRELENAIRAQLVSAFPALLLDHSDEVKAADDRAYQLECYYLRGRLPDERMFVPDFRERAVCRDLLRRELSWRESVAVFMQRYGTLFPTSWDGWD